MIRGIIFPTQDGMSAGGDGSGDLGKVEVHRLGIGAGQHEARDDGTSGADSSEEITPLVAGVALGAGPCAALGPDAGECALLANPCFILEPYFQRLALCSLRDHRRDRFGEVFLNASWASGSDFGCCGRDLQPPKTERRQLFADRPLVQGDAELCSDAGL